MKHLVLPLMLLFFTAAISQPNIALQSIASGFNEPVDIESAGDDRLFVVEQGGIIKITDKFGNVNATPFLNLTTIVNSSASEQGLLGLAFHPNYSSNGYFYVSYTGDSESGTSYIYRYSVSGNPDIANPSSGVLIYSLNQPSNNHNGGDIAFGPDGHLYIGFGDGGGANDPNNYAQNPQNILGKMVRIDVDGGSPYVIPPNNPFVGDVSTLDEIWALGLRNPWRFSFDRSTGDLWIADVGQNQIEEVNKTLASSTGGENYGWRCYEGNNAFNTSGCSSPSNYVFPVSTYSHSGGNCSVTGGFVYRGYEHPSLQGYYFYVDYCSGIFRYVDQSNQSGTALSSSFGFSSFGEDNNGELYVSNRNNGIIYKIIDPNTVKVSINVNLSGPFDNNQGLMHDSLRFRGLLGGIDPYGLGTQSANGVFVPTGDDALVDWVVVELRESGDPSIVADEVAAFVQRDGDVVSPDGVSPVSISQPAGNYYVAVRHRNHLGVMTASSYSLSSLTTSINFSTVPTYGTDAQQQFLGKRAMWDGDVNADGVIKYTGLANDRDPILIEIGGTVPTNISSGYLDTDVNMDGDVKYTGSNNDRDILLTNIGGVVPTNTRFEQLP